jgi:acetyl-CoA carboxylase biotin carboxyl carrier protein
MSSKQSPSGQPAPFDLDKLRELIELMEKHDLTEIKLQRGEEKWQMRRGPQGVPQMMPAAQPMMAQPAAAPPPVPAATSATAAETPDDGTVEIKSPTVGTFYSSPSPDDPPFVAVGAKVQPDTVVCLVEAMKVFNQIPAEVAGAITAVLVNNGEPVEFNQPLFRVRPG